MASGRRTGEETRRDVQRVAFELFTTRGYEATSLREIAEELGINKASLYYHFPGKEAILRSLFVERGAEAEDLVAWFDAQPASPDLLERSVLRWVESFTADKLRGIRFVAANPLLSGRIAGAEGERIGAGLHGFAERLVGLLPSPTASDALRIRMALLSINFAVEAAADTDASDDDIVRTASAAARAIVRDLTSGRDGETRPG
jgi:AcrR family transcriptional regulator